MHSILRLSGLEQASLIRNRTISSCELVGAHLQQIDRVNPQINAVVETLDAMSEARAADAAVARGEAPGPLHGVPFSVKDSIEVAGTVCTAGTTGRLGAPASTEDATLVKRLRAAGAIPIARTNLPDLLFSFESDNLIYGRTNNPYDLSRTAGGSSGGEAALIASCGSAFGLGSDAAGSVRVPAAFSGIASIKPTSGRLPRTGHFPAAGGWLETLWQIGPMARRVRDLWALLPLLMPPDGVDTTVVPMPFCDPAMVAIPGLRVAYYTHDGFATVAKEVAEVVSGAALLLARAGARVTEDRPLCLPSAFDLEMKLIGPDGGDSLWRYLEQLGSREIHPLLRAWLERLAPYRTDIAGLQKYWAELDEFRRDMLAFAGRYDVLLAPVYTQTALPHGASLLEDNFRGFNYTMGFNVCGWPAAVVRCGADGTGLPIAVQVIARPWREDVALAVAAVLEDAMGGWVEPEL